MDSQSWIRDVGVSDARHEARCASSRKRNKRVAESVSILRNAELCNLMVWKCRDVNDFIMRTWRTLLSFPSRSRDGMIAHSNDYWLVAIVHIQRQH